MSAGTGTTDNAQKLLALLRASAVTEPVKFTESGKAEKVAQKSTLILQIKGAGKATVEVGPTEKVEGFKLELEFAASTVNAVTIPLPEGWWAKTTLTTATITKAVVIPV